MAASCLPFLVLLAVPVAAGAEALVVDSTVRPPYAPVRAAVEVTVGESVSLVTVRLSYLYVRDYDSKGRNNPMMIDVPVIVREQDTEVARLLEIANARIEIDGRLYRPTEALRLDHTALPPVPDLPDEARIALISFNIPRGDLPGRFRAHLVYEQPHVVTGDGEQYTGYLPLILPDFEQLKRAVILRPEDFTVTFTALPNVRLRRVSVNAEVLEESAESISIRPRLREMIGVVAEPIAPGDGTDETSSADVENDASTGTIDALQPGAAP